MSWTITVDGDPQSVPAEDGQTVLDALLEHGVGFAYSCQAGNCGTCKCEYVSGEIAELEYSEHALSLAERGRGTVLACRTQVWGDVRIRRLSAEERRHCGACVLLLQWRERQARACTQKLRRKDRWCANVLTSWC